MRHNYNYAISKKRAMGSLVKDIRNYANLSSLQNKDSSDLNASQEVAYLSQRHSKLDLTRGTDSVLTQ